MSGSIYHPNLRNAIIDTVWPYFRKIGNPYNDEEWPRFNKGSSSDMMEVVKHSKIYFHSLSQNSRRGATNHVMKNVLKGLCVVLLAIMFGVVQKILVKWVVLLFLCKKRLSLFSASVLAVPRPEVTPSVSHYVELAPHHFFALFQKQTQIKTNQQKDPN